VIHFLIHFMRVCINTVNSSPANLERVTVMTNVIHVDSYSPTLNQSTNPNPSPNHTTEQWAYDEFRLLCNEL